MDGGTFRGDHGNRLVTKNWRPRDPLKEATEGLNDDDTQPHGEIVPMEIETERAYRAEFLMELRQQTSQKSPIGSKRSRKWRQNSHSWLWQDGLKILILPCSTFQKRDVKR
jgi:hypothetical protein